MRPLGFIVGGLMGLFVLDMISPNTLLNREFIIA